MEQVGKEADLSARYVEKLGQQEDEIEKLQDEIEQLNTDVKEKRQALEQYLVDLDLG